MIRITTIVIGVDDLQREAGFGAAGLDYVPRDDGSDDSLLLCQRDGAGPHLSLAMHAAGPAGGLRIHLDLCPDDPSGEVARLVELGATEVHLGEAPGRRRLCDPSPARRVIASASCGVNPPTANRR